MRAALALLLSLIVAALAGVAGPAQAVEPAVGSTLPRLATAPVVRIGFFANLTHAPALVAQELRLFQTLLGKDGTRAEYVLFNAGPAVIEAMKGGAIDVAYIGPTPAVTGYATTRGSLLRVVAGAASGGAQLVVRPSIDSVADLKGKKLATPQLGNTQDVALRSWLKAKGLSTTVAGGGDVPVYPTANATTLALFRKGDIDGAWVPEPWASRLVVEGGGRVLVDEASLWPRGDFVTTNIIASQDFLSQYPGTVRAVIQANSSAITYIRTNPAKGKELVQRQMRTWTGKTLPPAVLDRSWGNLTFTWDPLPTTLKKNADDAVRVGLLPAGSNDIDTIYDLRLLNQLLAAAGKGAIDAQGLGVD
jgi:NitT/TauT family transport system substrate-binding protein